MRKTLSMVRHRAVRAFLYPTVRSRSAAPPLSHGAGMEPRSREMLGLIRFVDGNEIKTIWLYKEAWSLCEGETEGQGCKAGVPEAGSCAVGHQVASAPSQRCYSPSAAPGQDRAGGREPSTVDG
jgi:hypothetical protein